METIPVRYYSPEGVGVAPPLVMKETAVRGIVHQLVRELLKHEPGMWYTITASNPEFGGSKIAYQRIGQTALMAAFCRMGHEHELTAIYPMGLDPEEDRQALRVGFRSRPRPIRKSEWLDAKRQPRPVALAFVASHEAAAAPMVRMAVESLGLAFALVLGTAELSK